MHWLQEMYKYHPMLLGGIIVAIFNCAITTLPTPDPTAKTFGGKFYQWFFNFTHALILAIPRIWAQYKQEAPKP